MPNELIYQSEFSGQQMDERFRTVATLAEALTVLEQAIAAKYTKPASGIPSTDMDADVQAALAKANSAIQSLADYYTKAQVDAIAAAIAATVNSTSGEVVASLPDASASTLGKIYYVGPTSGEYARYVTSYDGTTYSWLSIGTTDVDMEQYAKKSDISYPMPINDYRLETAWAKTGGGTFVAASGATPANYKPAKANSTAANPAIYKVVTYSGAVGCIYAKIHVNSAIAGSSIAMRSYRSGATTSVGYTMQPLIANTDIEMFINLTPASNFSDPRIYLTVTPPSEGYEYGNEVADIDIYFFAFFDQHLPDKETAARICSQGVQYYIPELRGEIEATVISPKNDYRLTTDAWVKSGDEITYIFRAGNVAARIWGAKASTGREPSIYCLPAVSGKYAAMYVKGHVNSTLQGATCRAILYLSGTTTQAAADSVEMVQGQDFELFAIARPSSNFSNPRLYVRLSKESPYTADTIIGDVSIDYAAVFDDETIDSIGAARMACASSLARTYNGLPTNGRIWSAVGDSLTYQGKYIPETQSALQLGNVVNVSAGGKRLSGDSVDNPAMWTDAVIGQINSSSWLITVLGGGNDWAQDVELGTNDSTDTDTVKGALNVIITKITTAHPLARLVILTLPYQELPNREGWENDYTNQLGLTPYDYAQAMEDVCALRGVPCVNFAKLAGWNHENITTFVNDDGGLLHPNDMGGNRMAAVLVGAVKAIMPLSVKDV